MFLASSCLKPSLLSRAYILRRVLSGTHSPTNTLSHERDGGIDQTCLGKIAGFLGRKKILAIIDRSAWVGGTAITWRWLQGIDEIMIHEYNIEVRSQLCTEEPPRYNLLPTRTHAFIPSLTDLPPCRNHSRLGEWSPFSDLPWIFLQTDDPIENKFFIRAITIHCKIPNSHSLEPHSLWLRLAVCFYALPLTLICCPGGSTLDFWEAYFDYGVGKVLLRFGVNFGEIVFPRVGWVE